MCDIQVIEQEFSNGTIHLRQECKKCGKFFGYKQKPIDKDKFIFYFGKYKGLKFNDVPESYLMWLLQQDWVKQNLKEAITTEFAVTNN
jgi:uncharacterized protein (DUF3820 family)